MRRGTSETNKLRTETLSVGIPIPTKKKDSRRRQRRDVSYTPKLIAFVVALTFIFSYGVNMRHPANGRVDVPSRTELNISANVRENLTKQLRPLASELKALNSNLKELNYVLETIDNKPAKPEEVNFSFTVRILVHIKSEV